MKREDVKFLGMFQVWSYSVSHGQLLIRSTKERNRATQIDILFSNVAAISLPTFFENIEILLLENSGLSPLPQLGENLFVGRKAYRITGLGVDGYVVAGDFVWEEGDREYDSVSNLICS